MHLARSISPASIPSWSLALSPGKSCEMIGYWGEIRLSLRDAAHEVSGVMHKLCAPYALFVYGRRRSPEAAENTSALKNQIHICQSGSKETRRMNNKVRLDRFPVCRYTGLTFSLSAHRGKGGSKTPAFRCHFVSLCAVEPACISEAASVGANLK